MIREVRGWRYRPRTIDSGTLWQLHLAVAANDRARGDTGAAERSMRSARAHAAARKLIKKLA